MADAAIKEAVARLRKRATDPRAIMAGIGTDLDTIGAALEAIEERTRVLAAVIMRRHYWPDSAVGEGDFVALAIMAADEPTLRALRGVAPQPGGGDHA